jgi:hypothetical protein
MPAPAPTGYSEFHSGGGEGFPITINSGVYVRPYGPSDTVLVWSSATNPPSAIFRLLSSSSPGATPTRIEELFILGGKRAIKIASKDENDSPGVEFSGVIARCQFAGNQIAVDLINDVEMIANIAIRDCKIRSGSPQIPSGIADPPVLQSQNIGIRLLAVEPENAAVPPQINAEIKNLDTVGTFDFMSSNHFPIFDGWHDIELPPLVYDFTRLIEILAKGRGTNLEHSNLPNLTPIPEVKVQFIGGNLYGMADQNNLDAGWQVGIYACTSYFGNLTHKDFLAGYKVETSGTIVDGFKLAGVHGTCKEWGRGEISLNGNTEVRGTGRQSAPSSSNTKFNGVHMTAFYSYLHLDATDSNIHTNTGSGIYLRAQSSKIPEYLACPTGNMLDAKACNLYGNAKHGISLNVEEDGIVGGAMHHPNGQSLLKDGGNVNYSVDFGQGSVNSCAISNNGKAGIYFNLKNTGGHNFPSYACIRFTNSIIWNNAGGGYLADLTGNATNPYLLTPIGHCTFAGNGNSVDPFSLKITEEDRANGSNENYSWTGPGGGTLSTKIFNSIFERKNPNEDDFPNYMIFAPNPFLVPNSTIMPDSEIGVAGIRYQDGGTSTLFGVSTYSPTPFVDNSSWAILDPSKFYLLNHGASNVFGQTPTTFPIDGNETAYDHQDDLRPVAAGGTRDKGADEK